MGVGQALRRFFTLTPVPMQAPAPRVSFSASSAELLLGMDSGETIAPRVTRAEALQVPAVLRARNIIAGTLSTLPMHIHDKDRNLAVPTTLLEQIDPDVANSVTMARTYEDLLFEGIAWWRVTAFGWHGYPISARHVPVESVHVPASTQELTRSDDVPPTDGRVLIDGRRVPDAEIIRFDSPNPPLLKHAARAIRTALKLDRAAALYADDPMPLGYFEDSDDQTDPLEDEDIEAILSKWEQKRRSRSWGYISKGLKLNELEAPTPEKLQLHESRQHAVLEIARATGMWPEDLGVSTTSRTYQNIEQKRLDVLDFTLGAYVTAVQERLSMRDVLPRGYFAKVKFDGFLRSDTKSRMQAYKIGRDVGAYTTPEIRALEDRPDLTPAEAAQLPQTRTAAPGI